MKLVGMTLVAALLLVCIAVIGPPAYAQSFVEFAGTVLKVDAAAGKLTVKKEGTRFTFVVDGRTQYKGIKDLKDIKSGDAVMVSYIAMGGQYVAQKIVKK